MFISETCQPLSPEDSQVCPIRGQRTFDGAQTPMRSRPSGWGLGLAPPNSHTTLHCLPMGCWPLGALCTPRPPGFLPNFLALRKDLPPHHTGLANFYCKDQLTLPAGGSSPDRPPHKYMSVPSPSSLCGNPFSCLSPEVQGFSSRPSSRSWAPGRCELACAVPLPDLGTRSTHDQRFLSRKYGDESAIQCFCPPHPAFHVLTHDSTWTEHTLHFSFLLLLQLGCRLTGTDGGTDRKIEHHVVHGGKVTII